MAKLTLTDVTDNGIDLDTNINANNALIEAAVENTLSRDGTSPNTMSVNIDMNSNRITNLADGVQLQDAVTLNQLTNGALSSVSLSELEDVDITSIATDDLLQYNGSSWVNIQPETLDTIAAENVTLEDAGGSYFATDVEGAFLEITGTAGGSIIGIADNAGLFNGTTVEEALEDLADGTICVRIDGDTMSGDLNMADNEVQRAVMTDYGVTSTTYTPSGTTQTIDYTAGNAYQLDLESATGDVTITLSNPPATGTYGEIVIRVEQDSSTPRNLTWPASVKWPGGTAPTISTGADAVDIITLRTWDAGTTWYGNFSQDYS